jgi:hypothetical protein
MLTLRTLAIAVAAAGVLAGLPARSAQACDNDRYPCPVVAQPQEADPAVQSPPSRKKASRAAPHDEKARAKTERQTSQAPPQTNPVAQEQAANTASRKGRGVVPARNEEVGRNQSPAAAAASLVRSGAAGTGAQGAAGEQNALTDDATPTFPARGVKIVDPNDERTRPRGSSRNAGRVVLAQLPVGDPGRGARRSLDRAIPVRVTAALAPERGPAPRRARSMP